MKRCTTSCVLGPLTELNVLSRVGMANYDRMVNFAAAQDGVFC